MPGDRIVDALAVPRLVHRGQVHTLTKGADTARNHARLLHIRLTDRITFLAD